MIKPARCPHCKRAVPALRVAGKVIVLPHMADGSKRVFGKTCGAKQ